MFLATTALSEFWDPNAQVLFLGPWCTLYGQKDKWAHLDYRFLPNPWDDREKFWQAGLYCQQIYENLLVDLGALLNKIHGVSFSDRYWQILLGPWFSGFIDIFYDRYTHIKEALEVFPELQTYLLDESMYLTPCDFQEFISMQGGDYYNLQLYSQILRSQGYYFPTKQYTSALSKNNNKINYKEYLIEIVRKFEKILINKFFSHKDICFLEGNVDRWVKLKLLLTPGFGASFINREFPQNWSIRVDYQNPMRRQLANLTQSKDPFIKILMNALPTNFPVLYLEGYKGCRSLVVDQFSERGFPKILLGMGRLWTDDYGKFLAGEIIERGGRIISFQHGAGYGFSRLLRVEEYERQVNDRFYTWGWASQEDDPKLTDLPSGKLVFRERQPGKSSWHSMILLVGTGFPRYLYRFQSYPVGSQWVQYIQATKDFLEALEPQKGKNLVYRGCGIDYGWAIPEQLQERFPQLAVDNHSHPYAHQMNKSRVLVFDHPSTPFLEAMAANIPSILFFEPRFWDAREAAQPYLDMLRLEGILHDSAQAAAQQVNQVYDHIDQWWFSAHLQEVRKLFIDHFALSSNGWNRQWTEAIRRELATMSR